MYYFVSILYPDKREQLAPFKPRITELQLVSTHFNSVYTYNILNTIYFMIAGAVFRNDNTFYANIDWKMHSIQVLSRPIGDPKRNSCLFIWTVLCKNLLAKEKDTIILLIVLSMCM